MLRLMVGQAGFDPATVGLEVRAIKTDYFT